MEERIVVNLEEMRVSWRVPEAVGTEMVVVLRMAEQVESEGRVAVEAKVEIRLVIVEKMQFKLIVLVMEEQRSFCYGCNPSGVRNTEVIGPFLISVPTVPDPTISASFHSPMVSSVNTSARVCAIECPLAVILT